ncbi:MAG: diguanylate cyclase, partial [Campylobacteraceae bacterium]|nr:diguanylate cyclase [Campylobacteraceae bacterium]
TEAISIGVNHYLLKPINAQELLNAIEIYAKNLMFERERKEQERILQSVINSDRNMIVAFNSKKIIFSNKSFLHFYNVETNLDFIDKYTHIFNTFLQDEQSLSLDVIEGDMSFEDVLFKTKDEKRVVKIHNDSLNICKTFYVNISTLFYNASKSADEVYLLNLTDITSMSKEKLEIEDKAYHDGLTNVYNRYKLEDIFEYELKQFKRYKRDFCFAILDIDFFRKFNDTYGHLIGDEVLISISSILQKNIRESDVVARWGGEEFVILLPNTSLSDAFLLMDKLRKIIEDFNHEIAGGITASFGVTTINENDDSYSVFKRADEALYEAKDCGRNLVISRD